MARRTTIGDNPLDALLPEPGAGAGRSARSRAFEVRGGASSPGDDPVGKGPREEAQYLTFELADEVYAVDIFQVCEILQPLAVTRVPSTPAWIRGVMNLRGNVVPVVDLAVKLGLPRSTPGRRSCIVLAEVDLPEERTLMGVWADAAGEVVTLTAEEVEPAPAFGTRVPLDYLLGMAPLGERFVPVVDLQGMMSVDEFLFAASLEAPPEAGEEAEAGPSDEGGEDPGGPGSEGDEGAAP